jgi:hypothetical protein
MIAASTSHAPTSPAVMAQRHEPHDSLDFFPTPPWGTRALCDALQGFGFDLGLRTVAEPACGEGHMARPLAEFFATVHASDIHPYGFGEVADFLFPSNHRPDWIITNPPFRLALQFAQTALDRAQEGVALLVRSAWLEGVERHRELFEPHPPFAVAQFVERLPMHRGRLLKDGSTATAYCWVIWVKGHPGRHPGPTRFHWIAPCRKRLERAEDYQTPTPQTEGNHQGPQR